MMCSGGKECDVNVNGEWGCNARGCDVVDNQIRTSGCFSSLYFVV